MREERLKKISHSINAKKLQQEPGVCVCVCVRVRACVCACVHV